MWARVRELRDWAAEQRPVVALSHNSYAQIVAARLLRLPAVTAMDYEHQPANHLGFRLAGTVLLPEAMRSVDVARQGATARKTRFYPGLKEEIYLGDFEPDPDVLDELGVRRVAGMPVVVARTPPDRAFYHQFGNPLFLDALRTVCGHGGARCVVLVRYPEQREAIAGLKLANCTVPTTAVDSRSLMCAADLVIGAGGTMTREAALLGVRTVSVYAGRSPAVDRQLERQGRLQRLRAAADLLPIQPSVGNGIDVEALRARGAALVEIFVEAVLKAAASPRRGSTR
jgi:predicted glycosyltransferase